MFFTPLNTLCVLKLNTVNEALMPKGPSCFFSTNSTPYNIDGMIF
jgi:hypothetical protein